MGIGDRSRWPSDRCMDISCHSVGTHAASLEIPGVGKPFSSSTLRAALRAGMVFPDLRMNTQPLAPVFPPLAAPQALPTDSPTKAPTHISKWSKITDVWTALCS